MVPKNKRIWTTPPNSYVSITLIFTWCGRNFLITNNDPTRKRFKRGLGASPFCFLKLFALLSYVLALFVGKDYLFF